MTKCLRHLQVFNGHMLLVMLEEYQVAMEGQEVGPPESKALMGKSWIGKPPRASGPEYLLLLLCLHTFSTVIFLCYLEWCVWVCQDPHRL